MIMTVSKEPTRALTVRLPESLYQRVRAAAHGSTVEESVPVAEFIRHALEEATVPPPATNKEKVRAAQSHRDVQASGSGNWLSGKG
jgi:plasmid stability protein